jgi:MFS family permease
MAVPAALALIGSRYPPGPERTRALSLLAEMACVGDMIGFAPGRGAITDLLGWRWVFLISAPAGSRRRARRAASSARSGR